MRLRCAIVDDEPLARDLLGLLLAEQENVEIVAKCQNGREAIAYLQSKPVDLLFLDVEMPEIDGFGVVQQVGLQHLPPTVFVTAYQKHAVRAFDIQAVDYLTKPVDADRLAIALERVREKITAQTALLTQEQLAVLLKSLRKVEGVQSYSSRFLVKDGEKEIFLSVEKIDWIEASAYYCGLHTNGRTYMLRETVTDLNAKLDPRQFVRIHRSSIVNVDRIREIHREGQSDGYAVLMDGQTLRISKAGRQKLTELGKS
jgi:two-component system, LytTR family, response regulator